MFVLQYSSPCAYLQQQVPTARHVERRSVVSHPSAGQAQGTVPTAGHISLHMSVLPHRFVLGQGCDEGVESGAVFVG
jgi:hypothetical protein